MVRRQPAWSVGGLSVAYWVLLAAAIVVTTAAALGVHEVMLEGMHVPYPHPVGLPVWATYLNQLFVVFALMLFCRLVQPRFSAIPIFVQCLLVTTVYVMLHETFRTMIIDSVLSNAWIYQLAQVTPRLLYGFILCGAVVLSAPRLKSFWSLSAVALIISAAGMFAIKPSIDAAFKPLFKSMSSFDLPQIYQEPFKGHVLVVIYITFVEAVFATFAIAAVIWPKLSPSPSLRLLQFVALVMFIKGSVLGTALYSFWIPGPLPVGILSESQFALETMTMAILTGLSWRWLQASPNRRHAQVSVER